MGLGVFGLIPKVSAHLLLNFRKVALSCIQDMVINDWIEIKSMCVCKYISGDI